MRIQASVSSFFPRVLWVSEQIFRKARAFSEQFFAMFFHAIDTLFAPSPVKAFSLAFGSSTGSKRVKAAGTFSEISNLFCHTVTHTIRYAGPLCTTVHGISCFMNLVSKDLLVFFSAFVGEIYVEQNFRANQIFMEY